MHLFFNTKILEPGVFPQHFVLSFFQQAHIKKQLPPANSLYCIKFMKIVKQKKTDGLHIHFSANWTHVNQMSYHNLLKNFYS